VIRYLTTLDVVAMNEAILQQYGSSALLRDEGALESAIMRPQMAAHYEGADLLTQTALLIAGITLAHAFLDGNKRTALAAGTTFLHLNGQWIVSQPGDFGRQIEALVNRPDSLEEAMARFLDWLRPRLQPL
jgi:death on curing protein